MCICFLFITVSMSEAAITGGGNAMKKYMKPEIIVENLEEDLAILTSGEAPSCDQDFKLL